MRQSGRKTGFIVRGSGDAAFANLENRAVFVEALFHGTEKIDHAANGCADDGLSGGHCFDQCQRRAFVARSQSHDVDRDVDVRGAARAGGYPVGFEFLLAANDTTDSASLGDLAVRELKAMGLYPMGAKLLFSIGGVLPVGLPTFSLENRRRLVAAGVGAA